VWSSGGEKKVFRLEMGVNTDGLWSVKEREETRIALKL
jgi:hypothetical protein